MGVNVSHRELTVRTGISQKEKIARSMISTRNKRERRRRVNDTDVIDVDVFMRERAQQKSPERVAAERACKMHVAAESRDAHRNVGDCTTRSATEQFTCADVVHMRLCDKIDERLTNAQHEAHRGLSSLPQNSASLNMTRNRGAIELA